MRVAVGLVVATLGGLSGCGAASVPDAGIVGCETDPRAQTYMNGMTQAGMGGKYTVQIVSSDPSPPLRGNNTWVLKVTDNATQQPVSGATLGMTLWMPDHGHGSSVTPTITSEGDSYSATPLYLFMPGLWQITVTATQAGVSDSAVFNFCVAG